MYAKVFVYGSLKKGFGNHDYFLGESSYLGVAITEPEFTMKSLTWYPGLLEGGNTCIHGEVYSVTESQFQSLDQLEGYPDFYNRKEIETKYGTAWVYYLKDASGYEDNPTVKDGIWEKRYG